MNEQAAELYTQYTLKRIDRRQFLERLAVLAGGMAAAYALLPVLENSTAQAAISAADDSRLSLGRVQFPTPGGTMQGYEARAKEAGKLPAVLVVHENRGLNAHIEDVTRRLALAGFLALAPDALSLQGGTPADQEQAIALIKGLDMGQNNTKFYRRRRLPQDPSPFHR
jgi:carboxymethylenebutenolidase